MPLGKRSCRKTTPFFNLTPNISTRIILEAFTSYKIFSKIKESHPNERFAYQKNIFPVIVG